MKESVSAKALAEFFGADPKDVTDIEIVLDDNYAAVTVIVRDADGNPEMIGPNVAKRIKTESHVINLDKPGRPVGTTVANGAKPKTKKLEAKLVEGEHVIPAAQIMHGGGSD